MHRFKDKLKKTFKSSPSSPKEKEKDLATDVVGPSASAGQTIARESFGRTQTGSSLGSVLLKGNQEGQSSPDIVVTPTVVPLTPNVQEGLDHTLIVTSDLTPRTSDVESIATGDPVPDSEDTVKESSLPPDGSSKPAPKRKRKGVIEVTGGPAIAILTVVKESLDGVPVIGLKAAVGGFLEILKAVKKTDDNVRAVQELERNLEALSNVLQSIRPGVSDPTLDARVKNFTEDIQRITTGNQGIGTKNYASRLVSHQDNFDAIAGLNLSLAAAIERFQTGVLIVIESGVTFVREEVGGVGAGVSAVQVGVDAVQGKVDAIQSLVQQMRLEQIRNVSGSSYQDALSQLPHSVSAEYDSLERASVASGCYPGTRTALIDMIVTWAENVDLSSPQFFWLCGLAGTGKSSVAQTVAEILKERKILGSTYFFSRDSAERNNTALVISTIAYQLARFSPAFKSVIIDSLIEHPEAHNSIPSNQLKHLIVEPLQKVTSCPPIIVVIMDALDECRDSNNVEELLRLLASSVTKLPFRLKFFVTSRPEPGIQYHFDSPSMKTVSDVIDLHEIKLQTVEADIQLFIRDRLHRVGELMRLSHSGPWPTEDEILQLARKAAGLFIFASTAVIYIGDPEWREPRERLELLLSDQDSSDSESPFATIDGLYIEVLKSSLPRNERAAEKVVLRMRRALGAIVVLLDPVSLIALENLLGMQGSIGPLLQPLASILAIPRNILMPLRLIHKSLPDFLTDPGRCVDPRFHIDPPLHHRDLALVCLQHMNKLLRRGVCGIADPLMEKSKVHNLEVQLRDNIPPHLLYACRFWASHLSHIQQDDRTEVMQALEVFCRTKILAWLEVLGYTSHLGGAVLALKSALDWLKVSETRSSRSAGENTLLHHANHPDPASMVSLLLYDCQRFLQMFSIPIDESPSHIYVSALSFMPSQTTLFQTYRNELTASVKVIRGQPLVWDSTLSVLRGHTSGVLSVALSSDGTRVASGSSDQTVRVWDIVTGAHITTLEGHTREVNTVAFSPDQTKIASGADDDTIILWDAASGCLISELRGHDSWVRSIAFSPDGTRIASASADETLRVWDIMGLHISTLEGHSDFVQSVAFSPDGARIVSGSYDETVKIWDTITASHILTMKGHTGLVESVKFSPDGAKVASASDDEKVIIWDSATGSQIFILEGFTSAVLSVAFSTDGSRVVSGSHDQTLRIWDIATGSHTFTLEGHTDAVQSVVFSSDGSKIVSGSDDGTIRVWDNTMEVSNISSLDHHSDKIVSVVFSPDGTRIASGSSDMTIRVWDTTTGSNISTLEGHTHWVDSVAFSSDGIQLASGSSDKSVKIWNILTGSIIFTLAGHTHTVDSVSFSPDGTRLASGSSDETIRIWDPITGSHLSTLNGHTSWVTSVAFSPDGTKIISGSLDQTVKIWELLTGSNISTLHGHTALVKSAVFSLDGHWVQSSSYGETIYWDLTFFEDIKKVDKGAVQLTSFQSPLELLGSSVFYQNRKVCTLPYSSIRDHMFWGMMGTFGTNSGDVYIMDFSACILS